MSKRHKKHRPVRDVCRAQYEFPGASSAAVLEFIDQEDRVMAVQAERYGDTPMLAKGREIRQRMRDKIREWQSYAQFVTDYDCAREAVTREKRS